MSLDAAPVSLLGKYNVPGPRYTSYPTVPYWQDSPTAEQWIGALRESIDAGSARGLGAALYVHIPFCESLCTYCGCNTRITRNHAVGDPYVSTVLREWELYRKQLGIDSLALTELHLGGGTPTFLSPLELGRLVEGILAHTHRVGDAEYSVEVDPRVTTRDQLTVLRELGFRRLSLGVQDFDPRVQQAVHRIQSEEQVREITEIGRELGYDSVNYDLIYGLPFQTLASIDTTLQAVRRLRPDRIAFYGYAHVPWIKPGQRRFTEADLPSGADKRALYEHGRQLLEEEGYREIGMDHFALETDSLWRSSVGGELHRNFMGYTAREVIPLIGLGVSSIGDAWSAFAQNEKLLERYSERVESGELPLLRGHRLTHEDLVLRRQILNLMTRLRTDWSRELTSSTDPEHAALSAFLAGAPERLAECARDGLVRMSEHSCEITESGRAFLRNVCMAFDARLYRQAPGTRLFSQTV